MHDDAPPPPWPPTLPAHVPPAHKGALSGAYRDLRGLVAPVRAPHDAARILNSVFHGLAEEHHWVLFLDRAHRPLALRRLGPRSDGATALDVRQVLRLAVFLGADSVVIAHTHPSGACSPSPEDLRVTRHLVAAGTVLGVRVVDHLVFAHDTWTSFALQGLL